MPSNFSQIESQYERWEKINSEVTAAERLIYESNDWTPTPIERWEHQYDTPRFNAGNGFYSTVSTQASDKQNGRYIPFYQTESDLASIRAIGRWLAGATEIGAGLMRSMLDFTVGNGMEFRVVANQQANAQQPIIQFAQKLLDDFCFRNTWQGDMETEFVQRSLEDGETFLALIDDGGYVPCARIVEPDFVTQPTSTELLEDHYSLPCGCDWSFGVASPQEYAEKPLAYFVAWGGVETNYDVFSPSMFVHAKANVTRNAKRGLSDFFAAAQTMEREAKLSGNVAQQAAIQACISEIREHAAGMTAGSVQTFQTGATTPGATSSAPRQKRYYPGMTIDTTANTKYMYGPMGSPSGPQFIEVIQALLRRVGVRWGLPEFIVSGDASNGTFSSTLMTGGPFDRAITRKQGFYVRYFQELAWKVLAFACAKGIFRAFGIGSVTELRRVFDVTVDAPSASVSEPLQQEQIRKIRSDAGILSQKTWATQAGLDFEVEQANGAAVKQVDPFGMPFGGSQDEQQQKPGQPKPNQPPPQENIAKAIESLETLGRIHAQAREVPLG